MLIVRVLLITQRSEGDSKIFYHEKFIEHHHLGEWFRLHNDIVSTVSKLQKELDFTPFIWDRANPSAIEGLLKLPEPDVELNPE